MGRRTPIMLALALGALPVQAAPLSRALGVDTIAELAEKAAPAVVNLDTVTRRTNPMAEMDPFFHRFFGDNLRALPPFFEQKGVGTGFLISPDGLIVTNHHVIRSAAAIRVTLQDGKVLTGKVVGDDPASDLALVKVEARKLPTLSLAEARRLRVGEWVVAIGSPLGLSTSVTAGIVSALNRDVAINDQVAFIQTDAPINPGNSGGPLLNLDGRVIGVNTAIAAKAQGIGFAIPVETVRYVVDALRRYGRVERPWLGVALDEAGDPDEPAGVRVAAVADDSPAYKGGLRAGDVVVEAEGKAIADTRALTRVVARHHVGDQLHLGVLRQGVRRKLVVTLEALPASRSAPAEPPAESSP